MSPEGTIAPGELSRSHKYRLFLRKYENSFPKFRLTGTIPDGDVYPVIFQNEVINVDSVINRGGFLCMKPGIYYFSVTAGFDDCGFIELYIMHNAREVSMSK